MQSQSTPPTHLYMYLDRYSRLGISVACLQLSAEGVAVYAWTIMIGVGSGQSTDCPCIWLQRTRVQLSRMRP